MSITRLNEWAENMPFVVEPLPRLFRALGSTLSTTRSTNDPFEELTNKMVKY